MQSAVLLIFSSTTWTYTESTTLHKVTECYMFMIKINFQVIWTWNNSSDLWTDSRRWSLQSPPGWDWGVGWQGGLCWNWRSPGTSSPHWVHNCGWPASGHPKMRTGTSAAWAAYREGCKKEQIERKKKLKMTFILKDTMCSSPTLGGRKYLNQCKDGTISLLWCCAYLTPGTLGLGCIFCDFQILVSLLPLNGEISVEK